LAIAAITGSSVRPSAVSLYSVFGGTTGYSFREIRLKLSSSFNSFDRMRSLIGDTAVYVYGFLGGPKPISLTAAHLMGRNLSFQRFSNFMSPTVRDEQRLAAALATIGSLIGDPMFKTRIGKEFSFDQIDEAMAYSDGGGGRALLV
jgi:NADPH:quinone reductase-like Zn-dependent oxidoreductase